MEPQVAQVRSFNRFYTRQIALLHEHLKAGSYNLSESRVLWEIEAGGHSKAADIARAMGVDPAFLSRLVAKLGKVGLLSTTPNTGDRRQNDIVLTSAGAAAFAQIDGDADKAVAAMLSVLDPMRRRALLSATQTIHSLLDSSPGDTTIVLRPHRMGEIGWLIHRQAVLYREQFGWNDATEGFFAGIYAAYMSSPSSPPKALWIAERAGAVVGSVFVIPAEGFTDTAQLRMLYVEPEARGLGIGTTLVTQCLSFAGGSGYKRIRLLTESVLSSARKIYDAAGFKQVESRKHDTYAQGMEARYLERDL